jgi:hypothetical protein
VFTHFYPRVVRHVSGNVPETFLTIFCHTTNLSQWNLGWIYVSEKYKFTAVNKRLFHKIPESSPGKFPPEKYFVSGGNFPPGHFPKILQRMSYSFRQLFQKNFYNFIKNFYNFIKNFIKNFYNFIKNFIKNFYNFIKNFYNFYKKFL